MSSRSSPGLAGGEVAAGEAEVGALREHSHVPPRARTRSAVSSSEPLSTTSTSSTGSSASRSSTISSASRRFRVTITAETPGRSASAAPSGLMTTSVRAYDEMHCARASSAGAGVPRRRRTCRCGVTRRGCSSRPEELRRHLTRLREWGYRLVTLRRAGRRSPSRGRARRPRCAHLRRRPRGQPRDARAAAARGGGAGDRVRRLGWLGEPYPWADWTRIVTREELRELRQRPSRSAPTRPSTTTSRRSPTSTPATISRPASARSEDVGRAGRGRRLSVRPRERGRRSEPAATRASRPRAAISGEGSWDDPHNLPRQDMLNRSSALGLRLKRDDLYEPLMRFAPARAARRASRVAEERWRDDHRAPRSSLVYHGVGAADGEDDARRLLTSPEHLEPPTSGCSRGAATASCPPSELPQRRAAGARTAALTFDDGWRNWLTRRRCRCCEPPRARPPSSSAPGSSEASASGRLPARQGALLDEAESPRAARCGDGARLAHARATPTCAGSTTPSSSASSRESKQPIEGLTGEPCRTLAYPYGLYDERVVQRGRRGGLRARVRLAARALAPLEAPRLPAPAAARRAAALAQARSGCGGRGGEHALLRRDPDEGPRRSRCAGTLESLLDTDPPPTRCS